MLKFIAILLLFYFFFRSVVHIMRLVFGEKNTAKRSQNPYTKQYQQQNTQNGLHIDSIPNKKKQKTSFKGDDYIDYEELE